MGTLLNAFRVEETWQFFRTTKADFELKNNKKDWIEESIYGANSSEIGTTSLVVSFNPKGKVEALYYYTGEVSAMAPWARFDYDEQGKLLNIIGLTVNNNYVYHGFCAIDNVKNKIRIYSDDCSNGFYDKMIASIKKDASGRITILSTLDGALEYRITYDSKGRIVQTLIFAKAEDGVSGLERKLTYNAQGFVQSEIIISNPEAGDEVIINNTYEYEYDKDLDWITKMCYNANGELQYTVKRSFERPNHMMNHIYND